MWVNIKVVLEKEVKGRWYFEKTKNKKHETSHKSNTLCSGWYLVARITPGWVIISVSLNGYASWNFACLMNYPPSPDFSCLFGSGMPVLRGEEPDVFLCFIPVFSNWFPLMSSFLKRTWWSIYSFLQSVTSGQNFTTCYARDNEVHLFCSSNKWHHSSQHQALKASYWLPQLSENSLTAPATLSFPPLLFCRLWNQLRSKQTLLSCL